MCASPLSTKYVTPKKQRVKSRVTPPSVDYSFYNAYRAGSWAGALVSTRCHCSGPPQSTGIGGQSGEWWDLNWDEPPPRRADDDVPPAPLPPPLPPPAPRTAPAGLNLGKHGECPAGWATERRGCGGGELTYGKSTENVLRRCTHAFFERESSDTTTLSALASVFVLQAATGRSRDAVRPAGTALRYVGQRLQRGQQRGQTASGWKCQGQVRS
jgi:hypothetical protein